MSRSAEGDEIIGPAEAMPATLVAPALASGSPSPNPTRHRISTANTRGVREARRSKKYGSWITRPAYA